ncbi:MAG: cyclase family protein [Vulcanisaeta sp.]|uniref:cyclase family protein n=1 Tax=Vulcanisaeta sp. TaxID=2020871 RepID=UPI0023563015
MVSIKGIYDLSVSIRTYMPVWPTNPLPDIKPVGILSRDGYNAEFMQTATHTGTHVDSPYHMLESNITVDQLDLGKLVGYGYVVRPKFSGTEITASDLAKVWRSEYDGSIILIETGWWKKRAFTKEFLYDFPGLSFDAGKFVVEHKVKTIGIDTLGIEPYNHTDFAVHKLLLSNGIYIIEDLSNLDQLVEGKKYLIVALPIKLQGASGAMARVIAIEEG